MASAPLAAGRKAARQLFKDNKAKKTIHFSLRETSQESKKKMFFYVASKVTLDKPKIITRGDSEIKITTEYKVSSCKQ